MTGEYLRKQETDKDDMAELQSIFQYHANQVTPIQQWNQKWSLLATYVLNINSRWLNIAENKLKH